MPATSAKLLLLNNYYITVLLLPFPFINEKPKSYQNILWDVYSLHRRAGPGR